LERLEAAAANPGHRLRRLAKLFLWAYEAAKFGAVGAVAWLVDNGAYLLLTEGPGGLMAAYPVRASIIASAVATAVSYLGNRYWTFAGRRAKLPLKEAAAFVAANGIGLLITGGCLYLSRWVFGFHGAGPDVIARNLGIVLGTVFRYLAYKFWVFTARTTEKP
jgi:putative flippase GtrA